MNAAKGEWLSGAFSQSWPSTQAPRKSIAPGTACSTREKSSEPVIGSGIRANRWSPSAWATTCSATSTSSSWLTVTGYCRWNAASTSTPCAAATPWT